MHAIRLAVQATVAGKENDHLFHVKDHRAQIVKHLLQLFQNLRVSTGGTEIFQRIYFGEI